MQVQRGSAVYRACAVEARAGLEAEGPLLESRLSPADVPHARAGGPAAHAQRARLYLDAASALHVEVKVVRTRPAALAQRAPVLEYGRRARVVLEVAVADDVEQRIGLVDEAQGALRVDDATRGHRDLAAVVQHTAVPAPVVASADRARAVNTQFAGARQIPARPVPLPFQNE